MPRPLNYERRTRRLSGGGLAMAVFELLLCCFYGFAGLGLVLLGVGIVAVSLSEADVSAGVALLGLPPLLPGVLLAYFALGRATASVRVLVHGDEETEDS